MHSLDYQFTGLAPELQRKSPRMLNKQVAGFKQPKLTTGNPKATGVHVRIRWEDNFFALLVLSSHRSGASYLGFRAVAFRPEARKQSNRAILYDRIDQLKVHGFSSKLFKTSKKIKLFLQFQDLMSDSEPIQADYIDTKS